VPTPGTHHSSLGEAMLLDQAGNAAQVEVEVVLPADGFGQRRITASRAEEGLGHLLEVAFESAGGDDLKDRGHGVAGVPEGVRNPTRLEDEGARPSRHDLIADLGPDLAADDERDLVLVVMRVDGRREGPRLDRMLDQSQPAARLRASGQIARSHTSKV